MEIREATARDVEGIFHVRTSVRENLLTPEELSRMGITPAAITELIQHEPCAWVAVDDGSIVGFSMVDLKDGALFAAFVLPSHEGMGIGRALVQRAEERLFTTHDVARLETGAGTRAAGFYRHLGWSGKKQLKNGDIRLEKRRGD